MRKGKDVIGRPIVSLDLGCAVEQVKDLIFDRVRNRVVGLLVDKGSWFRNPRVLPLRNVHAMGNDAITVPSGNVIVDVDRVPDIQFILERKNVLHGTKVMTSDGAELGTIKDVCFDETTGNAEAFEIATSTNTPTASCSTLPASEELMIGEDVAVVSSRLGQELSEQQNQSTGDCCADRNEEQQTKPASTIASELENAGEKFRQVMNTAGERLNEGALQIHKTASELWKSTKEKAGEMQLRAQDAIDERRIQKVLGRPTNRAILDANDHAILSEGELITHEAIERARNAGVLHLVLSSVASPSCHPTADQTATVQVPIPPRT